MYLCNYLRWVSGDSGWRQQVVGANFRSDVIPQTARRLCISRPEVE